MRVLVAGAGAAGSWIGGALAAGGASVALVARGAHGDAIRRQGLTLHGDSGRRVVHVHAPVFPRVGEAAAGDPYDAVLVCVKSYDTAALADELVRLPGVRRVVGFQNGVGNEAVLADRLPGWTIIPASLTTGVTLVEPGIVEGGARGGIALARVPGEDEWTDRLADLLRGGGLSVLTCPDGVPLKWSKLLLNMLGNATCAILRWPPGRVFADRGVFELEHRAWLEAIAVMRALHIGPIALPGYPVDTYVRVARRLPAPWLHRLVGGTLARARGTRMPGAAIDLAAGRPHTEVEVLNGAVVQAGARAGVATPVNRVLAELAMDLSAGRVDPAAFIDRPAALIEAVRNIERGK